MIRILKMIGIYMIMKLGGGLSNESIDEIESQEQDRKNNLENLKSMNREQRRKIEKRVGVRGLKQYLETK